MGLWILPFLDDDNRDRNKKRENDEIVKKRNPPLNRSHARTSSLNWIHLQQLALSLSEMTFADFSSVLRRFDDATNRFVSSSASSAATSVNKLVDSAAASIDTSLLPTSDDIAKLAEASFFAANTDSGSNCGEMRRKRRNSEEELLLKILWKE